MGNFYVNHTVVASQDRVVALLERERHTAFVSPTVDGQTVVCDQQCDQQDPTAIVQLGRTLSAGLDSPVLAVLNHDDDLLCYWVFEHGELIEQYDSCDGYFDDGGDDDEEEDGKNLGGLRIFSGEQTPAEDDEPNEGTGATSGAAELCRVFGKPAMQDQVKSILAEDHLFALETHHQLVSVLGLPDCSVGAGYGYVSEADAELDPHDCVHVGR